MRKKIKITYPIDQVIQLAIIVDDEQGFIKSGYGYYDHKTEKNTFDNKSAIVNMLVGNDKMPEISQSIVEQAQNLKETMRNNLIAKKLMGTLSSFETSVSEILSKDEVDGFGISIIASLPNSLRVQNKRDSLEDWFESMRDKSEFVGKVGDRIKMDVLVKDVKYINKYGIHVVTCVNENDIIKFFFNREPDISGIVEGKNIVMTGKVKTQDVSKFSGCKETVFNYVKIEETT